MLISVTEKRLEAFPALVLNADYRPLSLLPLELMCWQDAVKNTMAGQVDVVAEYDVEVRSPSTSVRLPAVVALRAYVRRRETPPLNRHNLLVLRDRCACAFCGHTFPISHMTWDHVIPRAQGGKHRWENLVGACTTCNWRKADRTPEQARMPLLWRPRLPSMEELARAEFFRNERAIHGAWREFLPFAA